MTFVFAVWLFKGKSKYITKHLMYTLGIQNTYTVFIRFSPKPRISAHPLPPNKANKKGKKRNSTLIVKRTRDVLIISFPQWLTMDDTVRQPFRTLGSFNWHFHVGTSRNHNESEIDYPEWSVKIVKPFLLLCSRKIKFLLAENCEKLISAQSRICAHLE